MRPSSSDSLWPTRADGAVLSDVIALKLAARFQLMAAYVLDRVPK